MILPNYLRNGSPWLSEFSRLFESGLRQVGKTPPGLRVFQDDSGWSLELDYPGVAKADLSVKVENGVLLLEDSREGTSQPSYRLPLGEQIDPDQIKASLEDGVLTLHLQKKQADRKTIEIL